MNKNNFGFDTNKSDNQESSTRKMNERIFHMICNTSTSSFLYYNFTNKKMDILGSWSTIFNFKIESMNDYKKIIECVSEEYTTQMIELLFSEKKKMESASLTVQLLENKKWINCKATIIYDIEGRPIEKLIRFKDVTKEIKQKDELDYISFYDSLTGLFNRNYFINKLSNWLEQAACVKSIVSVMFLDIVGFRKINDGMGMIVGDELVQVFGQYLNEFSSETIMVSHFSGDLFCIGVYDPSGTTSIEFISESILKKVEGPFKLSSKHELIIDICIGVAEYPEAGKTAIDLINYAEIIMFKGKGTGKDVVQFFDEPILREFLQNVSIEHKLKEAIVTNDFTINFQPQYDVSSNKLRGVEALIRWKDIDGNVISPSEFIPIAEQNGTIIPIGAWVLEESMRIFAQWKLKYQIDFILSINISALQFKREDFIENLELVMAKNKIDSNEIELEITESIFIDDLNDMKSKMKYLRKIGIRVSLDDFGTGYSSLAYLKGLPIDTLKIDKSFVDTIASDETTRIILESIITMVKRLGFETVAEGVETQAQYDYLKGISCDNIQGFLLGKPMDALSIEKLIKEQYAER